MFSLPGAEAVFQTGSLDLLQSSVSAKVQQRFSSIVQFLFCLTSTNKTALHWVRALVYLGQCCLFWLASTPLDPRQRIAQAICYNILSRSTTITLYEREIIAGNSLVHSSLIWIRHLNHSLFPSRMAFHFWNNHREPLFVLHVLMATHKSLQQDK